MTFAELGAEAFKQPDLLFLQLDLAFGGGLLQQLERAIKGVAGFAAGLVILAGPIGQDGVADEFVHGAAMGVDDVAGVAEPFAEGAGQDFLGQNLGHGGEAADVADHHGDDGVLVPGGVAAGGGEGDVVAGIAGGGGLALLEGEFVVGDADDAAVAERGGSDDAAAVDEGAVAAAEIHDLVLIGVVAADDGMLAGGVLAEMEAHRVVAATADGGGVADLDFKRFALGGPDFQHCAHNGRDFNAPGREGNVLIAEVFSGDKIVPALCCRVAKNAPTEWGGYRGRIYRAASIKTSICWPT